MDAHVDEAMTSADMVLGVGLQEPWVTTRKSRHEGREIVNSESGIDYRVMRFSNHGDRLRKPPHPEPGAFRTQR